MSQVDILSNTIAEMTWYQVEAAARGGAVALWAFGVIEQHGPHLPAGTDVYLPSARLRRIQAVLKEQGVSSVIVPPYYWGVNHASASFPASFQVRPEVMIELMADVFASLARDGFRSVFCITGHGDARHNQAIYTAILRSRQETSMDISFLADEALVTRLKIALGDRAVTPYQNPADPTMTFPDVHAGKWETSMMLALRPDLVGESLLPGLQAVAFTGDDLAEWRQGHDVARRKTPLGYVGDPAKASRESGLRDMEAGAVAMVAAIRARIGR
jgi:creatinine amidohydrolase